MIRNVLTLMIALLCLHFSACKKVIEKKQEQAIVQAMTDGHWKINFFSKNGTAITADFSNYKFKYYENRKVDAILNNVVEQTGDWDGDPSAMTTWADFPSATDPILLLNGTWHIDKNTWTHVELSQTAGSEVKLMWLDKL